LSGTYAYQNCGVAPTFSTDPTSGDVITGTSVLKVTFSESVTGVSPSNVVIKNGSGVIVPTTYSMNGNTYTVDPTPDLTSGTYYLAVGYGTPIQDADGITVSPATFTFQVDDARATARSALETAGLSVVVIAAADQATTGVTNNLLSVIPAMMSAGISAAADSSSKQTIISSLLGATNGASSLTSTAGRTITRISDTTNFTILLSAISDVLVAQAVAGNLTATELGNAVTTVNDSLDDSGADADQASSFEATFNSEITADVAAEISLSAEYLTAVSTATGE
jgi:hypothetical protein